MKSRTSLLIASLLGGALLSASCGGGSPASNDAGNNGVIMCPPLTGYKSSTTTPLTLTADIQPILQDVTGCGIDNACHGTPGVFVDGKNRMQSFGGSSATLRAFLLGTSVNAPTMNLVKPGDVGASFLAYKISGPAVLACVDSICVPGASIGPKPCGDAMPLAGYVLTDANRTKILDWIAQGAVQ